MLFLFCFVLFVFAEESADDTIIVEEKKDPRNQAGSISIIDTSSALGQADIGELLSQQTSITVRRFGGLGAYSTLSVRGSSADQTTIMINGIPLNPEGSSTVNLSELPLSAFSTVELYRSHAPLALQSSSIGGLVNLVPKTEKQHTISAGTGSFQTLVGEASATTESHNHQLLIFARHFQTEGDFQYFDDNATLYNQEDDQYRQRRNNSKHQQNILFFDSKDHLSLLHNTHFQNGGVGGSIIMPFTEIALSTSRHLSALRWNRVLPLFSHQLSLWHVWDRSVLDDLLGEMSGAPHSEYQSVHQIGARGFHQFAHSEFFIPSLGWINRWEQNQNQNLLSMKNETPQQRLLSQLQLGSQIFLWDARFENQSAVQLYSFKAPSQEQFFLAPRTSFLFRVSDIFLLWSAANRSFRPPTMMELYGNQASVVGNPDLIPETAVNLDGGAVWKQEYFSLQAGYFCRWGQDNIILLQNAQNQSIPFNFAKTRIQGLESTLSLTAKEWLHWNIGLTWNHSINLSDIPSLHRKQLPNIPSWNIQHQLQLHNSLGSIQHRWSLLDQNYSDATNQYLYPTRAFHNIELSTHQKNIFPAVSLVIRNLSNTITEETLLDPLQPTSGTREQAVSDFIGYPLPGRHLFLTLTWDEK